LTSIKLNIAGIAPEVELSPVVLFLHWVYFSSAW